MRSAIRYVAAVVVGLLLSLMLIVAVELFGGVVHPLPENFGGTSEEMCRHVERFPPWVLAVVVPAWAVAAFVGTWTAGRIGNFYSAATVGSLLLVALLFNVSGLPYPMWFKIANLVAVPIAVVAGRRLSAQRRPVDAAAAQVPETNPPLG
jgi:hypothetical protein